MHQYNYSPDKKNARDLGNANAYLDAVLWSASRNIVKAGWDPAPLEDRITVDEVRSQDTVKMNYTMYTDIFLVINIIFYKEWHVWNLQRYSDRPQYNPAIWYNHS